MRKIWPAFFYQNLCDRTILFFDLGELLTKLSKLLRIKDQIKPKTYIEELAELGLLEIYVNDFLRNKFETDEEFKQRIYDALLKYEKSLNTDVEVFFMEKMVESLGYFLEFTRECRTRSLFDPK